MEAKSKPQLCNKLVFREGPERECKVRYGIIESEDDFFISFKTANRNYRISKAHIIVIEETNRPFYIGGWK